MSDTSNQSVVPEPVEGLVPEVVEVAPELVEGPAGDTALTTRR